MRQIKIKSLKELFETVKDLNKDGKYWFRGHADTNYILVPSAYRKLMVIADQFGRLVDPRPMGPTDTHGDMIFLPTDLYLNTFFEELDKLGIIYDTNMNIIDKLCLAQHYGVYTPMLDWSTDFSVGCFFACDGKKKNASCDIYMLDPVKWNNHVEANIDFVFNSEQLTKYNKVSNNMFPLAVKGSKDDRRMCRQSGNFTKHGMQVGPLSIFDRDPESDILIRLTIEGDVADELAEYLEAFGINHDSMYVKDDEKDIVAKSLKAINEESFEKKIEEFREEWLKTPEMDRGISHHIM